MLQSYIWQEYDLAPRFPRLHEFLEFWTNNLDGRLHCIRVASAGLLSPREVRYASGRFAIN